MEPDTSSTKAMSIGVVSVVEAEASLPVTSSLSVYAPLPWYSMLLACSGVNNPEEADFSMPQYDAIPRRTVLSALSLVSSSFASF